MPSFIALHPSRFQDFSFSVKIIDIGINPDVCFFIKYKQLRALKYAIIIAIYSTHFNKKTAINTKLTNAQKLRHILIYTIDNR